MSTPPATKSPGPAIIPHLPLPSQTHPSLDFRVWAAPPLGPRQLSRPPRALPFTGPAITSPKGHHQVTGPPPALPTHAPDLSRLHPRWEGLLGPRLCSTVEGWRDLGGNRARPALAASPPFLSQECDSHSTTRGQRAWQCRASPLEVCGQGTREREVSCTGSQRGRASPPRSQSQ